MELKYQTYIDTYTDCDFQDFTSRERIAFRWAFEDIKNEKNFLPRYLTPAYDNDPKLDCVGYALSMFDMEQQAIKRLEVLSKGKQNIYKKLGTHLASGIILKGDGISGPSSTYEINQGHFSIFEYVETDFASSFKIVKKLINE